MTGLRIRVGENLPQIWGQVTRRAVRSGGMNVGDPTLIRITDTRPLEELVALRSSQIQLPRAPLLHQWLAACRGLLITPLSFNSFTLLGVGKAIKKIYGTLVQSSRCRNAS